MKKLLLIIIAFVYTNLFTMTHAGVIPVDSKVHGKSYAEWSATWWQWALSLPSNQNPFFDQGPSVNGANGQFGHVWFLTGVFNESGIADRTLVIPAGTFLFFPLINTECSTVEVGTPFYGSNEQELRECASGTALSDLVAEIDGVPVANLSQFNVTSPMFQFTLPENNVLGVPAGNGYSVSNGYYIMLSPLSVGEHTIHFGGTYADFNFTLDITYHITVAGGK